jgi:hypothetical protein
MYEHFAEFFNATDEGAAALVQALDEKSRDGWELASVTGVPPTEVKGFRGAVVTATSRVLLLMRRPSKKNVQAF